MRQQHYAAMTAERLPGQHFPGNNGSQHEYDTPQGIAIAASRPAALQLGGFLGRSGASAAQRSSNASSRPAMPEQREGPQEWFC